MLESSFTRLSRNGKFIKYNVSLAFVRITFNSIMHFLNELVKILIILGE